MLVAQHEHTHTHTHSSSRQRGEQTNALLHDLLRTFAYKLDISLVWMIKKYPMNEIRNLGFLGISERSGARERLLYEREGASKKKEWWE